jgi:agmatine deiminase
MNLDWPPDHVTRYDLGLHRPQHETCSLARASVLDARRMSAIRVPHETELHDLLWTAWPDHPDWEGVVEEARAEIAAFAEAAAGAQGGPRVVVLEPPDGARVSEALRERVKVKAAVYGDIWLRDTGPLWALDDAGRVAVRFRFNGWGGKYLYPGDLEVARALARALDARLLDVDLVAEGGAFEADGEGSVITTRACLLDRTRNPGVAASDVERLLADALGAERTIWLESGLTRDHTDGHVDTLARFLRPGVVVCQAPVGPQDPNAAVLDEVARTLDRARDAHGRKLDVTRVPSPGYVADAEGRPVPASHMNFVHAGNRVIVPVYGTPSAEAALAGLAALFPGKEVIGLSALALVREGGAFHCACNAAPAAGARA